ncbi:MAG: pentapeptide repeat-containing protein [Actinobacteria bacterium]|nr:pentapeptide repeat-containing protein [Actinomycetota bacterium]
MVKRQDSDGPAPPRLTPIRIGEVTALDHAEAIDGHLDLDAVELSDLRADELSWTGRRRLRASRVQALVAQRWSALGASVVGSVLDGVEVVGLSAAGSSWWNVEVTGSRIGSAELYDSAWRCVTFTRCKLGYLNLRNAQLTDVAFVDCVIEDLDLGRASATRVAFPGSRIGRLEVTGSKLTDVDLRPARLGEVSNLEGLRGASITFDQLLDLAPGLAARLGIKVE